MIGELIFEGRRLVHELHEAEIAIPKDGETHHVDGLELDGHKCKVDVLENGPNFPVGE